MQGSWDLIGIQLARDARDQDALELPQAPERRTDWVLKMLKASTKGLKKPGAAVQALEQVEKMLDTMVPGQELSHLKWLLRNVDCRGADVRLSTGEVLEPSRQITLYPAPAWSWKCYHAYAWQASQHINILEFTVFLNYLRSRSTSTSLHSKRWHHVFDSRICSCVVAKGRSSSIVLNRSLRRTLAFLLATDVYVLPLWTISKWNYCDAGSRGHPPIT